MVFGDGLTNSLVGVMEETNEGCHRGSASSRVWQVFESAIVLLFVAIASGLPLDIDDSDARLDVFISRYAVRLC